MLNRSPSSTAASAAAISGWMAPTAEVSAEDVAQHISEIRDLSSFSVPMWLFEEVRDVVGRVKAL